MYVIDSFQCHNNCRTANFYLGDKAYKWLETLYNSSILKAWFVLNEHFMNDQVALMFILKIRQLAFPIYVNNSIQNVASKA
jgi:hypothetical protein